MTNEQKEKEELIEEIRKIEVKLGKPVMKRCFIETNTIGMLKVLLEERIKDLEKMEGEDEKSD